MPDNFQTVIYQELQQFFKPITDTNGDGDQILTLFQDFGWNLTNLVGSEVQSLETPISTAITSIEQLTSTPPTDIDGFLTALVGIVPPVVDAITQLSQLTLPTMPPDLGDLPGDFLNYLILQYLQSRSPTTYAVGNLLGLITTSASTQETINGAVYRTKNLLPTVNWDQLPDIVTNTVSHFETLYGLNSGNAATVAQGALTIVNLVFLLIQSMGFSNPFAGVLPSNDLAGPGQPQPPSTDQTPGALGFSKQFTLGDYSSAEIGLNILPGASGPSVTIMPYGKLQFSEDVGPFSVALSGNLDSNGFTLSTSGITPLTAANPNVTVQLKATLQDPDGTPYMFGDPDGSNFSFQSVDFFVNTSWSPTALQTKLGLDLNSFAINIDMGEADSFLQSITGGGNIQAQATLTVQYSNTSGFSFGGSGGFTITLPTHITLGPITLNSFSIDLQFSNNTIPIAFTTDITGSLGPLTAVVQDIGLQIILSFPADGKGALGPVDMSFGFQPPDGAGLSLDVGVISGGGVLVLKPSIGEYYGALQLEFQDLFSLTAVGIINTIMPDGSPGFSLLIIITADFTPIQLGFGFTLNGVGGLLGLNRSCDIDVLRAGIKTGTMQSILFPQDVVANITQIISDLTQVFPPTNGQFVVGPMAELGWGDPSLITLEIGILLDLPTPNIAILGIIQCALPDPDVPLLNIEVDFLGVIDFTNDYISFNASLYDSNLLIFTLNGDMGFWLSWGSNPTFVLSVGGFFPGFTQAPASLQNMSRLSISLLTGDNPRLSVECYFAITSNTVQHGASAELYAAAGNFNVNGFVGYDLLFQFDPFKFIADFSASLNLCSGSSVICGIGLSGSFSGPAPFNINGSASISFFLFSVSVGFQTTWGSSNNVNTPTTTDVTTLLQAAVTSNSNWTAGLPANGSQCVSVRQITAPASSMVIHPFGQLTFSQRIVPLGLKITKFGNNVPDVDEYEVAPVDPGIQTASQPPTELFAMANFQTMTDNQKLSAPSFEPYQSGFSVTGSSALQTTTPVSIVVDYTLTYLQKKQYTMLRGLIYGVPQGFFVANLKAGSVARSPLSYANNRMSPNAPDTVSVGPDQYAIASTADLTLYQAGMVAPTLGQAQQIYDSLIGGNPGLKDQVQIVHQYELNPN